MIDRENVMKALECCAMIDGTCRCTDCPYYDHDLEDDFRECDERMQLDVLELMKADQTELIRQRGTIAKLQAAQEPCVLSPEEVIDWVNTARVDRSPIYLEVHNEVRAWIVSDEYDDIGTEANLTRGRYYRSWRCWTSKPTDEQREAEPWITN